MNDTNDGGRCAAPAPAAEPGRYDVMEALRRALNTLPRYSFWLGDPASVRKVPDRSGAWIEWQAAHELFDAEVLDNLLGVAPAAPAEPVNARLLEALRMALNVLHATGAMDEARAAVDAIAAAEAAPQPAVAPQPLTDAEAADCGLLSELFPEDAPAALEPMKEDAVREWFRNTEACDSRNWGTLTAWQMWRLAWTVCEVAHGIGAAGEKGGA